MRKKVQRLNLNSNLINEVFYTPLFIKRVAEKAGIDIKRYDINQLTQGFKIELEHGSQGGKFNITHDDPVETLKIVLIHLDEDSNYYTKLVRYIEDGNLNEKSVSKSQQRFMGIVHAAQQGKLDTEKLKNPGKIEKAALGMSDKDAKAFASTKHKGLPEKVEEIGLLTQGNHKLYMTKSVDNIDENKTKLISEFIKFCCKNLGINQPITVYLTGKRGGPIQTTASYNPNNHEIWIYVKNRNMLADPLRSLAHEIRHLKQGLDGVLHQTSGEDGSEHENEAHSFSGLMIRLFGKIYPEIFE